MLRGAIYGEFENGHIFYFIFHKSVDHIIYFNFSCGDIVGYISVTTFLIYVQC